MIHDPTPHPRDPAVSSPEDCALYRLRGTINGREKAIELAMGEHSVGSSRSADVVLPITGVSRRHARLVVTANALVVEDLGSTNGTAIDGATVESRSSVPTGAELRFGPARLQVEAVEPDDGELAISFHGSSSLAESRSVLSAFDPDKSTMMVGHANAAFADRWLSCIAELVTHLAGARESRLTDALAYLGQSLGAAGCCMARWAPGQPETALAAWGRLGEVPPFGEIKRLVSDGDTAGHGVAFFDGALPASIAASTRGASELVGLVIFGEFPGRLACASFARAALGLVEELGISSLPAVPPGEKDPIYPELVFPSWYRPGSSRPMATLYAQMRQLARSDIPVLIRGETGVGKELIARILHDSSRRREGQFVAINCAAIPANLLEAEMFGVEKGVATGVEAREGKFRRARGGTIFLDEIGEMAPELQAKLLRVLQEKEIQPLGGIPQPVDVRIVAATNVDLPAHMEQGRLRPDLYYRLAGCLLEVPALRQRPEDIPGLVEHFGRCYAKESGIRIRGLTVAALRALSEHRWPGNVRELEHEIRRLVYMSASGDRIGLERLSLRQSARQRDPVDELVDSLESLELEPALATLEERLIRQALERADWVKVEACRLLGLSRNGLDKKIKRLGIEMPGQRAGKSGRDS